MHSKVMGTILAQEKDSARYVVSEPG